MSTTITEQMSQMSREIDRLRKRLVAQQAILLGIVVIGVAAFCTGAASKDGHFDRVFAKSVIIRNDKGDPAVQLSANNGAASLLIRDSSGKEAIHLVSGSERNDLLINNRNNGDIAVAIQGMKDRGRLSIHQTFPNIDAAKVTLGRTPESWLGRSEEGEVTVPVIRLPEIDH